MGLKIINTKISGVYVVESTPISDNRGSFSRWFCEKELKAILGERSIVQINHSKNIKVGTIRGMHFQKAPHAEMKMVRCMKGRIFDVALDLRTGSPTFLQCHTEELSSTNNKMLVIPEGCAHGFQVLEDDSELLYLHTGFYQPSSEGGVRYDDPLMKIHWPLPIVGVSEKDASYSLLSPSFKGF